MTTSRVYKQAAVLLAPVVLLAAFYGPIKLPLGVLAGGLLATYNLRGISRGLKGTLGTERAALRMMLSSVLRLLAVFSILIALAVTQAVDLLGLLAGFTIVLVLIMVEGFRAARQASA